MHACRDCEDDGCHHEHGGYLDPVAVTALVFCCWHRVVNLRYVIWIVRCECGVGLWGYWISFLQTGSWSGIVQVYCVHEKSDVVQ